MARGDAAPSKGVESSTLRRPGRERAGADRAGAQSSGAPSARTYTSARMVMVGHSRRLAQPLTRGQQRVIALVLVAILAATAWAVIRPSSAPVSRNGCVSVVIPGSMGGGLLHYCGTAARSWCQGEFARTDVLARLGQPQCRDAGLRPRRS
jgi:hypothetical protein